MSDRRLGTCLGHSVIMLRVSFLSLLFWTSLCWVSSCWMA